MKTLLPIIGLVLSLSIQAKAVAIVAPEIAIYQEAVNAYLENNGTPQCGRWNTSYLIKHAQTLDLKDGSHPLLVFTFMTDKKQEEETGTNLFKIEVSTTQNYKTITHVQITEYIKAKVNTGDFRNPVMREDFIVKRNNIYNCPIH